MPVRPLTAEDPAQVAGYALRARLGSGGMGRVYLAATPGGQLVALKLIRSDLSDEPDFRHRFAQEAAAAQRVHGLYTAQVLDADPDAVRPWLVTAYVAGPSVQEAVEAHGPMPPRTVLMLMSGVAEGLQAIHAAGVVHRDLKPSNVLLAPDGPRVIDFGIARAAGAAPLTRSGIIMGSPPFMAPEQVAGYEVTPAIDIFALGSLAVFAALGKPPFGRDSEPAVLYRIRHEPPALAGCQPPLLGLAERCLAKEPSWRPVLPEIIAECNAGTAGFPASGPAWLPPLVAALTDAPLPPPSVPPLPGPALPAPALPAPALPVPPLPAPHPPTLAAPGALASGASAGRFGALDQVTTIGGPGGPPAAPGWPPYTGWVGPAGWQPAGSWPVSGNPVPPAGPAPVPGQAPSLARRSGWAVAAFTIGVAAAVFLLALFVAITINNDSLAIAAVLLGFLAVPAGLVTGITAVIRVRRRRLRGLWMALTGLAVTSLWTVFVVFSILSA